MYFVDGEPLDGSGDNGSYLVQRPLASQDVEVDGVPFTGTAGAGVVTMTFGTDGQMAPLDPCFCIHAVPPAVPDSNITDDPDNQREITLSFTATGGGCTNRV